MGHSPFLTAALPKTATRNGRRNRSALKKLNGATATPTTIGATAMTMMITVATTMRTTATISSGTASTSAIRAQRTTASRASGTPSTAIRNVADTVGVKERKAETK